MTGDIIMMSIVYILLIILLMVLIVLGIKAIFFIESVNETLDDIKDKLRSLDGIFNFASDIGYTLEIIDKKFVAKVDNVLRLVSKFRKGDDSDE